MRKKIRHVDELPEWFDIRPYEQWEDEEPGTAVSAVWHHLFFLGIVAGSTNDGGHVLDKDELQAGLAELKESAATPYQERTSRDSFLSILDSKASRIFDEKYPAYKGVEAFIEERKQKRRAAQDTAKEIIGESLPMDNNITHVTLADVMTWVKENGPLIEALEAKAADLASGNGLEYDEALDVMFEEVPIWNRKGTPFVVICGSPSIKAEAQGIERYLRKHRDKEELLTGKPSEVRKLFDYRFAAYADLKAWSYLTGNQITKKCMANALFPDGRYGELDMMPKRTLGNFYRRLEEDVEYIRSLARQAAEMESLQN